MATAKRENYSEELTAAIVERYQAGETVEAIAESIGKAVRSVRSKLVREGEPAWYEVKTAWEALHRAAIVLGKIERGEMVP